MMQPNDTDRLEEPGSPAEALDPALDPRLDQLSRRSLLGRATAVATASVLGTGAAAQEPGKTTRALADASITHHDVDVSLKAGADGIAPQFKGFLARPKTGGKRGAVIVVHEIFGLTDHIKSIACRLAEAGFTALAPDLFTREGPPPPMSGGFGPLMGFVNNISDKQIMADLKGAMTHLRQESDANGKVGVVGFCWGGRISMLLDANAPMLNAAVAYYGRISATEKTPNQPHYPIDLLDKMTAPLLGHFGAKDTGIPPEEAAKLRAGLKDAGKTAEIYVYEGAGHAFNNDTRESYYAPAADLAWKRTLAWFNKYLKA